MTAYAQVVNIHGSTNLGITMSINNNNNNHNNSNESVYCVFLGVCV